MSNAESKEVEMIAPTPEHHILSVDSQALPCRMAVQHICRSVSPQSHEWIEFLVRGHGDMLHLPPLDFVEQGYRRRGLLFDQDIFSRCLDSVEQLADTTALPPNAGTAGEKLRPDELDVGVEVPMSDVDRVSLGV